MIIRLRTDFAGIYIVHFYSINGPLMVTVIGTVLCELSSHTEHLLDTGYMKDSERYPRWRIGHGDSPVASIKPLYNLLTYIETRPLPFAGR